MKPLLEVKGLQVRYGDFLALEDVSFSLAEGGILSVLGVNGAGKSTLVAAIAGLVRPCRGEVSFQGENIAQMKASDRARKGVMLVPEGRGIFAPMTVIENLMLGSYALKDKGKKAQLQKQVLEYFPILWERRGQKAGNLSGGEQQMLAIGRALMSEPRLLLLDEPSLGLSPKLVHMVFEIIDRIHRQGTAIVLVEQNSSAAVGISDEVLVLEKGTTMVSGRAADLGEATLASFF